MGVASSAQDASCLMAAYCLGLSIALGLNNPDHYHNFWDVDCNV